MPRLPLLALALALALLPSATTAREEVELLQVYDGDTIQVRRADGSRATVRLIGVDAPEIDGPYRKAELGGEASTAFARRLMPPGPVFLVADETGDDVDKYDRLLRYVLLPDGRDVGAELIHAGFARTYRRFTYSRKDSYLAMEEKAKKERRGLWGPVGIDE